MMAMSRIVIRVDLAISNHVGYTGSPRDGVEGQILTVGGCIHALRLPADMEY